VIELIKKIFQRRIRAILTKLEREEIRKQCENANFFGVESRTRQVRGNGVLILTNEGLYFEMGHPNKQLNIPANHIKRTEIVKSYLHKITNVKLLNAFLIRITLKIRLRGGLMI
jgi:hypothetical protein